MHPIDCTMDYNDYAESQDEDYSDTDMPVGKTTKGHKSKSHDDHRDKRTQERKAQRAYYRKQHRELFVKETSDPLEDKRKHDEKLLAELSDIVGDYSQQRMRALHMSFRQYGNDENRMTNKEMMQSLQDNNVSIPSVLLKSLIAKFESPKGIDLEALFKFLKESHVRTGRDSVLAMHKRNDLSQKYILSQEELDDDLLWRIETQLIKGHAYIDLAELRTEFQKRDNSKSGRIDTHMMKHVCDDLQLPVFGSLLKNLFKRCDEDKNDKICWPQFLSFLERAQDNARISCPSLKSLPEQMKSRTPVEPTPLDELSSKTRLSIVSKLRKKSAVKKPATKTETTDKTDAHSNSVNNNNNHSNGVPSNKKTDINVHDSTTTNGHVNSPTVDTEVKSKTGSQNADDGVVNKQTTKADDTHTTDDKNDVDNSQADDSTESKHVIKVDVNIEQPSKHKTPQSTPRHNASQSTVKQNNHQSTPKHSAQTAIPKHVPSQSSSKQNHHPTPKHNSTPKKDSPSRVKAEVECVAESPIEESKPEVEEYSKYRYTDGDEEEEEERVTFKNGEIIAMEKASDIKATQTTQTSDGKTTVSLDIKDTTLTFEADTDYIAKQNIDPPTQRMRLQWVYGYRGNDCRKNIHILANGEILYFMSYIAIMYNRDTHKQRHYREHTDEIKCIDVHSNKIIVATGQYANRRDDTIKAQVRVWRSDNLHTLHVFGNDGGFDKSIACVAFAPDKDILAVVDNCTEKKLTVWNTHTGELKGQELLHTDLLCDMGFNTKYPDTLVTVGKEHTCWWKIYPDSETIQSSSKPDYDNFLRAKFVICLTFTEKGDLITGDSNGTIYVFGDGGNRITNFIKHAHDGPVFTVLFHQGQILSGGRDGIIHAWQWGRNMNSGGFLQLPKTEGGVRMLRVHRHDLLVGTTMNSMLACKLSTSDSEPPLQGAILEQQPLCQCHYDDLRGLTIASESRADVITAGLDGIICGFNSSARTAVNKVQYKGNQYVCVDSNATGTQLVLGTKDGHLQILCQVKEEWREVMNRKICKSRVDCIRLSPDDRSVAMGTHDGVIYIVSYIPRQDGTLVWEFIGKLQGHTGAVNGMDWSTGKEDDGFILRSSSVTMELKHWLPRTLEAFHKKDLISQALWFTRSVHIDVSTTGILSANDDKGLDITALDCTADGGVAVNGDNSGKLRLFKYPCTLRGSFCHAYRSHGSIHVVKFTACGKYVMTVGGRDSCLMQWMIV